MNSSWLWLACSVCFGDPSSPLTRGVTAGVLFLIGVVTFVLTAIFFTGIQWARKAKKLEELK